MKPKFIVVNWSKGSVVAVSDTEEEARENLKKATRGTCPNDTYLIASVLVMSELKRWES